MTESYDVIIIGAGPGGLSCAGELVKSNKSVLLLEKNNIIGPKICAGGIRESDFKHLGLESELRGSEVDQAGCLTVDRKDLAQSQLQKLDTKRIHIRTGSRVERIEEGRLTVHGHQEIRFKYLVGADGSMSIVRRYLKLRQEYVLFALQHLICAKLYDHLGEIKKNQYHYNKRFYLPFSF